MGNVRNIKVTQVTLESPSQSESRPATNTMARRQDHRNTSRYKLKFSKTKHWDSHHTTYRKIPSCRFKSSQFLQKFTEKQKEETYETAKLHWTSQANTHPLTLLPILFTALEPNTANGLGRIYCNRQKEELEICRSRVQTWR